jgi:hypothetical protein
MPGSRRERRAVETVHLSVLIGSPLAGILQKVQGLCSPRGASSVPNEIEFENCEPRYDFDRDCLAFRARVEGKLVDCLVTAELLMARFGARDMSEDAMREAFRAHRAEIEALARSHIETGWIDEDGRVFLTTRFTQLNVTVTPRAATFPPVALAHRLLTEIIGPNAEAINITWDVEGVPSAHPGITLEIADPSTGYNRQLHLRPKVEDDDTNLRLALAEIWAGVLRSRSRKFLLG